jgi:hypothetical protein
MPVRIPGDSALEISYYKNWPHFKNLYFLKDQYRPIARSGGIPPEEKKSLSGNKTDRRDGVLQSSQNGGSTKKDKPYVKVLKKISGDDALEFSGHSTLPKRKRPCLQKDQFTSRASSSNLPFKKKRKYYGDKQTDGEFGISKWIIADGAPGGVLD